MLKNNQAAKCLTSHLIVGLMNPVLVVLLSFYSVDSGSES